MYLAASDQETEIDRILFALNDGEEQLYRNPLTGFKKDEITRVRVIAIDLLDNRAEREVIIKGQ